MKKNTYVIGDIHGNWHALLDVIGKSPIKIGDKLIFLGDYGDGFPFTSEVVDTLIGLKENFRTVFLLGNHDVWVKDWINGGTSPVIWTQQGGEATIDSYIESGKFHDEDHVKFWNNLKLYYIENNNLYVHAGWDGKEPFEDVIDNEITYNYLEILWDRSLAQGITTEHTNKFDNIFIGHTSTKNHLPYNNKNIWNIDTGSGWDGKLTIMNADTKQYWQSKKNTKSGR